MTNEEILKKFDREFVKDCGPDVEPIFIDAVGSVGPIRQFLSNKLDQARAEERERMREKLERIKLDMDVVMCDCGEPYKDSDPAKLIDTLLSSLQDNPTDKE